MLVGAIALTLVIIAAGVWAATRSDRTGSTKPVLSASSAGTAKVPDLVGQTVGNAMKQLQDDGLLLGALEKIRNANVSVGVVVAQTPASGSTLPLGFKVNVVVSSGP